MLAEENKEMTKKLDTPNKNKNHNKSQKADAEDLNDELDLYKSKESKLRGIKNYGIDVKLFKWDYRNFSIIKIHIDETKKLEDLVLGTEIEDGSNEDDEEETELFNTKVEIKKFEIFSKKQSVKTDSVVKLRYTSFTILLFHIIMATIYFILSYNYINDSADYVNGVSYIFKQCNYTVSSSDILLTLILRNQKEYIQTTNTLLEYNTFIKKLDSNAMFLFSLDNKISEFPLYFNKNLSNVLNTYVLFNIIENAGLSSARTYNNLSFFFFESNLEVSIYFNNKLVNVDAFLHKCGI